MHPARDGEGERERARAREIQIQIYIFLNGYIDSYQNMSIDVFLFQYIHIYI